MVGVGGCRGGGGHGDHSDSEAYATQRPRHAPERDVVKVTKDPAGSKS